MRILRNATEDEVLECFVRAERNSERYGEIVRKLEKRVGDNPRAVLSAYRAWPDQGLFDGFPRDVRVAARVADARGGPGDPLHRLGLVADDHRRDTPAARCCGGEGPADEAEESIARGAATNPELIAVRAPGSYLVLLEGHVRLTSYAALPPVPAGGAGDLPRPVASYGRVVPVLVPLGDANVLALHDLAARVDDAVPLPRA